MKPAIIGSDMEGVLVPEIWIAFSEKTGIKELKLTTKDVSDYDELMKNRIRILKENNLKLKDIQEVISTLKPYDGAKEFLDELRQKAQVIVLSDTFYEFAIPLMKQLGLPVLFCHNLIIDDNGFISGYKLRMKDHKRHSIEAFKNLNFFSIAMGDSYNDTTMLKVADIGYLFRAPDNVKKEFPQFKTFEEYRDLYNQILKDIE